MSEKKQKVRAFVSELSGLDMSAVENDTPLITGGVIDSIHTLNILTWLEDQTGRKFSAMDMSVDQLDSIDAISKFLDQQ